MLSESACYYYLYYVSLSSIRAGLYLWYYASPGPIPFK